MGGSDGGGDGLLFYPERQANDHLVLRAIWLVFYL